MSTCIESTVILPAPQHSGLMVNGYVLYKFKIYHILLVRFEEEFYAKNSEVVAG